MTTIRRIEPLGLKERSSEEIDALIERQIVPRPHGYGPDRAALRDAGVSVWALIEHLQAAEGDLRETAESFDLPVEAVEAAYYYYLRHRDLIDARILLNQAAYEG